MTTYSSVTPFEASFFPPDETDSAYLRAHFPRFALTKSIFESNWRERKPGEPSRVLDIGAHWLHQAALWAADGYQVTGADFPVTLALPQVQALAKRLDIHLVEYRHIEDGSPFADLPDDSFDIVLFCEILEHITFNPVALWRDVYRVMAPGGRIVVTTPNYYWAYSRFWDLQRLWRRGGGGIPVQDILRINTYGHHWKEYSLREVTEYFTTLSSDFVPAKAIYVDDPRPRDPSKDYHDRLKRFAERRCRLFKWGLYVEIDLRSKKAGITVNPSW